MLNKWRRLFLSSRAKLSWIKMSARWYLLSMYRIWIRILWDREACLIVGLRSLIIILITASLSSKTYNMTLGQNPMYLLEYDQCLLAWRWCAWLGWDIHVWLCSCRQVSLWLSPTSLSLLIWFDEEWNPWITQMLKIESCDIIHTYLHREKLLQLP